MINTLVLFCGGAPIYTGKPKPLQRLRTGETLLECYLRYVRKSLPMEIVLLVEKEYEVEYINLLNSLSHPSNLRIISCANGSSTFTKLQEFLNSGYPEERILMFSYPDIFISGELVLPSCDNPKLDHCVFISSATISSRFPRIIANSYDNTVRGISNHTSQVPANPLNIFGGHLLVRAGLMKMLVTAFLAEVDMIAPTLEFDMFFWLINSSRMHSIPIYGKWIHADSPRELETILNLK